MIVGLILFSFIILFQFLSVKYLKKLVFRVLFFCVFIIVLFSCLYVEDYFFIEMGGFFDTLRLSLIILRFWVTALMRIARFKILKTDEFSRVFIFLVNFLGVILLITFMVGDYFYFYLFFEVSLIPTFFIIMGWGYQPERLQAGIYFIFYTLTASLPLLIGILMFFNFSFSLYYLFPILGVLPKLNIRAVLAIIYIIAFLVKLPIYITHL
jgi:NADH-ubiquinone oxidoreductase chain 4